MTPFSSPSSNQTNETDRRNQMNQLPATRREMVSGAFSVSEALDEAYFSRPIAVGLIKETL